MSTLGQRFRNTSPVFRVLLLVLLAILLLLLCLLVFLQFLLPIIRPSPVQTPVPTTPPVATATPTVIPAASPPPTPTGTPVVVPTETVVTTQTPGATTETPQATATTPVTGTPGTVQPTATLTQVIQIRNVLRNGDLEEGFQPNELGKHWKSFNNGSADFSFHIDDWKLVVVEGKYTQLIEIKNAQKPDRYLGMYQTARVIPGEVYTFSIRGLVRTNTGDVEQTSYGYRLQVGFDVKGRQDWQVVKNWVELPWDEQLRVQDSFRFDVYSQTITARSERLTVFIRAWKKWADAGEGDYDVDDIQLVGPVLVTPAAPGIPVTGGAFETILDNVRVWATIVLLLLLLGGAIWRLRWQNR